MTCRVSFFLFFSSLTLTVSIASAEERAPHDHPHGLARENPMAFSPSAYEFFHPTTQNPKAKDPCVASNCSPLPLAAQVHASEAHESKDYASQKGKSRLGAAGVAGIVFSLASAVFLAMGVYYVLITRRAKMSKANTTVQLHV